MSPHSIHAKYPFLVGICGNAGAGKDTFAEAFHYYKFRQLAFAFPVKAACCAAFGFDITAFNDREIKEEVNLFWNISPRKAAQLVGTELFRKQFGDDFWIRRLEFELIKLYDSPADVKVVISDVRFNNEAQWILDSGGCLVHLTRPGYEGNVGIQGHASEAGIDFASLNYEGDMTNALTEVTNTGTKAELLRCADSFVESLLSRAS